MFQNTQGHQRGDALAVGRDLVHAIAAVIVADRRDPIGAVLVQVLQIYRTAMISAVGDHPLGQLAAIKCIAASVRN